MRRYVLLVFGGTPLLLVITFTVGLLVAAQAGLVGIPLAAILFSWFFKYCFVVLDAIVAGDEELPVLSIEMVNPLNEQRPFALALLIAVEVTLVGALKIYVGQPVGLLAGGILTLVLPASIAVLGITGNPFRAASPIAVLSLIRGLGRDYALLNVVTFVSAGSIWWMWRHALPLWSTLAATQMLFLLTFALAGGAVFEHRHELGIDTRTRDERMSERDAREHGLERRRMLDRAYASFRVQKPLEGWQAIEAWMSRHGQAQNQLIERRAILDAVSRWDDVRPGDRLANDLVELLLARRANGEALDVVEHRLVSNPQFRLSQPAHAVRLAELAAIAGKLSLQRQLAPGDVAALGSRPKD